MRQFIAAVLISSVSMTAPVYAVGDLVGGDINFKGTVVAQGCSIIPSALFPHQKILRLILKKFQPISFIGKEDHHPSHLLSSFRIAVPKSLILLR